MNCTMSKLWWSWGSHSSDYEKYSLLGLMLCSLVEVHKCFGSRYCLHLQVQRARQASNWQEASCKQKVEAVHVNLYQTTSCNIPGKLFAGLSYSLILEMKETCSSSPFLVLRYHYNRVYYLGKRSWNCACWCIPEVLEQDFMRQLSMEV
jgi:hypothetical protein